MHRRLLLILAVLSLSLPAQAEQEFRAGGLVLKEAAPITVARQDVYLSPREIRVHYVYESAAEDTTRVTIGFPLPPVPLDDGPDYMGGVTDELPDPRNYLQFMATANGEAVEPQLREYAYLNGFSVTEELKAAGVPLYFPYEIREQALASLDEATRTGLVEQGLLRASEEGFEYWMPMWHYQTVYEWEQDFAPGSTELDIRYVPLNGYPSDIGTPYEGGDADTERYAQKTIEDEYCIDDALKAAIRKRLDAGLHYEIVTQGFIMRRATEWTGGIGAFNLVVDKADAALGQPFELVSFCPQEARKISDTQFAWSVEHFWPRRDIAVLYYQFYDNAE